MGPGVSVNVIINSEVHELASVTTTVYDPAPNILNVWGELALV